MPRNGPRSRPRSKQPSVVPRDGYVRVRGAREHNLEDIDVDLPRDALVVFSGVSGSGKSSLAFGTIYAEAQRRYFESVAPYGRRLIDRRPPARDRPATATRLQQCAPSVGSGKQRKTGVRVNFF